MSRMSRWVVVALVAGATSVAMIVGTQLATTDRDAVIAAPGSVAGGVAAEEGGVAYTVLSPAGVEDFEAFELLSVGVRSRVCRSPT